MGNNMPQMAQFTLPTPGQQPTPQQTPSIPGMPPVAQFSLPQGQSGTPQGQPNAAGVSGIPSTPFGNAPSAGAFGANLQALPGQTIGAANSLVPIAGDIGAVAQGKSTGKSSEQIAGDTIQSLLTLGLLIPGVDLSDAAAKIGLTGAGGRIATNAAIGAGIGAGQAMGQGDTVNQVAQQGLIGAGVGGVAGEAFRALTASQTAQDKIQSAIEDATPSYNKKLIGEPDVNGVPRVQESKRLFNPRAVTPSPSEIAAGTEASKLPDYPANGTSLQKFNSIQPNIAKEGQAMEAGLKSENVLRPPQELKALVRNTVQKTAQDSLLLQKSDPAVTNYLRVAGRAIDNNEGTLYGERQVQKAMDDAYEDAGGKYGNNKALDQIHRASRNALIDDMSSKAQSTDVKASLLKMKNLYNMKDVLQDKAGAEGTTGAQRLTQKYPRTAGAVTGVARIAGRYTGLDVALHALGQ